MKFDGIVTDLKAERDRIERAIAVLKDFDSARKRTPRRTRTAKTAALKKTVTQRRASGVKLVRKRIATTAPRRPKEKSAEPKADAKQRTNASRPTALAESAAI